MKITKEYTFFWDGVFSNWYPSKFTIEDHTFASGQQWMMFCKASIFKDKQAQQAIMETDNPIEMDAIGRRVKRFDDEVWDEVAYDLVKIGLREKFLQNPEMYDELMLTKDTTFVEASPFDAIWGIGMRESDPDVEDRTKWRGTNYLGLVLTEIRDEFQDAIDVKLL